MLSPSIEKTTSDFCTSGGRTFTPLFLKLPMYFISLSESSISDVRSPAANSSGKCAFRYAVSRDIAAYAAACDLLNAYFAKSIIWSYIVFATFSGMPFLIQPGMFRLSSP